MPQTLLKRIPQAVRAFFTMSTVGVIMSRSFAVTIIVTVIITAARVIAAIALAFIVPPATAINDATG